jgi:hypothetical protein
VLLFQAISHRTLPVHVPNPIKDYHAFIRYSYQNIKCNAAMFIKEFIDHDGEDHLKILRFIQHKSLEHPSTFIKRPATALN